MITMQTITAVGLVYLIGINLAGFIIMGVDKKRAIRGAWRISEASLFLTALLGGSLGCILGMQHFRHKTKVTKPMSRSTTFRIIVMTDSGSGIKLDSTMPRPEILLTDA